MNETDVERECNMNCRSEDCLQNFGQDMCEEESGLKAKHNRDSKTEVMGQQNGTCDILCSQMAVLCVVCHKGTLLEKSCVCV